ncbi:MAG: branched-chain amino acid ABC transporter permease [Desulfobacterales bacterium]|nr:MAG: branched-chain amino acid ABC transporter permease [Desulfobacterales bacterium]
MTRVRPDPDRQGKFLGEMKAQQKSRLYFLGLFVLLGLVPLVLRSEYYLHVLIAMFYHVIYATTYRFILRTGQFHFGAHAFVGIGAYASVLLVMRAGWSFWLAMPAAGLIAAFFAVLIGYPTLRLKGIYFAIITWGFGDTLRFIYMRFKEPFGGPLGIFAIPGPNPITIPGLITIDFSQKTHFYFLALALMIVTLYILHRMEQSRFGLIFGAIREGDRLARAVGINIMNYKVLAFAVCSGLGAMAGSFYAHYTYYISPLDFSVLLTIYLAIYTVVGGQERYAGVIVGTVVLMLAGEVFAGYSHYQLLMYSGFLIVILLFLPGGLISLPGLLTRVGSRAEEKEGEKFRNDPA